MINVIKFFHSKQSTRRKILDIVDDIKPIVKSTIDVRFWIDWYGAYDLDPKYLVIWICVDKDSTKIELQANSVLLSRINSLFEKHDYPKQAISSVQIGFESQETVNRVSKGDWYLHFK